MASVDPDAKKTPSDFKFEYCRKVGRSLLASKGSHEHQNLSVGCKNVTSHYLQNVNVNIK